MGSSHMTIRGAARVLGVHENTIRNWIKKKLIRAVRLPSGIHRVPEAEVERVRLSMIPAPTSIGEIRDVVIAKSANEDLEHPGEFPSSF